VTATSQGMATPPPSSPSPGAQPAAPRRRAGWVPPAYPYDRLIPARRKAAAVEGGLVDLSIGTPCDPPPPGVLAALADADKGGATRGYPPSIGTPTLRAAIAAWFGRTFDVEMPAASIAVTVGTKELVATTPQWLKLRRPDLDTVLYPAVSYPTYAMGASLAGVRAVPVPAGPDGGIDLGAISTADAERALMLWVNSPANPTGAVSDLAAAAAWGADVDVPVFSDECYVELTWKGPPTTIVGHGSGSGGLGGVVAVHSLSKRSNLAGLRVGWYAGDPDLVHYLQEVRKHVGMMVPGAAQLAAEAALADTAHVGVQRGLYQGRLARMQAVLAAQGAEVSLPAGGFYLWLRAPGGDAWAWTEELAAEGGVLVSPGDFYGPDGAGWVRVAMVQPDERIELVARRFGLS
jgi:succinyldiaminopimelate transaminase